MKTQRQKVLSLLQQAGQSEVSSYEFTFTHRIKQAPTRIHELKRMGFNIISKPKDNTVIYILSHASQVNTEPKIQPQEEDRSSLVPVEKTIMILGVPRTTIAYVRKEDVETKQLVMI